MNITCCQTRYSEKLLLPPHERRTNSANIGHIIHEIMACKRSARFTATAHLIQASLLVATQIKAPELTSAVAFFLVSYNFLAAKYNLYWMPANAVRFDWKPDLNGQVIKSTLQMLEQQLQAGKDSHIRRPQALGLKLAIHTSAFVPFAAYALPSFLTAMLGEFFSGVNNGKLDFDPVAGRLREYNEGMIDNRGAIILLKDPDSVHVKPKSRVRKFFARVSWRQPCQRTRFHITPTIPTSRKGNRSSAASSLPAVLPG